LPKKTYPGKSTTDEKNHQQLEEGVKRDLPFQTDDNKGQTTGAGVEREAAYRVKKIENGLRRRE